MVKRVIAYLSKTLNASQRRYCTTNKELLAVVTAVELFKYYLTGRHFTVVTDHASLPWLRNFRELEGVVARWITRLQPFDFKIIHRPGKHHSHADGLSRSTSRPCKRDACPEYAALINQATVGEESVRSVTPQVNNLDYFDGYIEEAEDDSDLFRDTLSSTKAKLEQEVVPELLWYLGRHSEQAEQTDIESSQATTVTRINQLSADKQL